MLFRSLFSLGLASIALALPVTEDVDTSAPGVYVTDTYTDHNGVERRSTQVISKQIHEKLIYYSEYNAAAYCPGQQDAKFVKQKITCGKYKTCDRVEKSNTTIYTTWLNQGSNSATGFVAADHTMKKIVVAMRGSVSVANWIADIKFFTTPCTQFGKGASCETGFYGFWEQSRNFAAKGLAQGLAANPSYGIIVTGHSLGAAAAVYAAGEYRAKYKDVELYSYGQPRAGNDVMSKFITAQGKNYRVTHTSDAVPKLPFEWMGYKHISPEYWISDGLGNKVDTIKVLEGISNNNGNTGTGIMKFNIIAHVQYFQPNMYDCVVGLGDPGLGYAPGTKMIDDGSVEWWPSSLEWPSSPARPGNHSLVGS
jgi:hypothetical protein